MSIQPPADGNLKYLVDHTAMLVAQQGEEFEISLRSNKLNIASLTFMTSSDPFHGYYQQKLTEYRAQFQDKEKCYPQSKPSDPFDVPGEPLKLTLIPEGITGKELDRIKLTALFMARFGVYFYGELLKRVGTDVRFEFIRSTTDYKSDFFSQLLAAYSALVKLSAKPDVTREALVDGFFQLLPSDDLQQEEGVKIDIFDLRALEFVVSLGDKEFPPARQPSRIPPAISVPPRPLTQPSKGTMQPLSPPAQPLYLRVQYQRNQS